MSAFEALGTTSVRALAEHLGRSAESLYFHIRKLLACGLVVEAGTRPTGRRNEQLYRLVARRLRIAGDPGDADFADAMTQMCSSVLRATERDYSRSLEAGSARLHGAGRNISLQHFHVHLSPQHRRQMVAMIEELTAFVLEHNQPGRGELLSYTTLLSPVCPPHHA